LAELGYHVREMNAGWEEWTKAGLAVEKVQEPVPVA